MAHQTIAIRVDNRMNERRLEKVQKNSSQGPSSWSFKNREGHAPQPVPMEIDTMNVKIKKLPFGEKQRRMKEGLCFYCGKPNHRASVCPDKKVSNNAVVEKEIKPTNSLYFLRVQLKLQSALLEVSALLDPGCSHVLMSNVLVDEYGIPTGTMPHPLKMAFADGGESGSIVSTYCLPTIMTVKSHYEEVSPLTADITYPLILG
jgi:hypothetical protein